MAVPFAITIRGEVQVELDDLEPTATDVEARRRAVDRAENKVFAKLRDELQKVVDELYVDYPSIAATGQIGANAVQLVPVAHTVTAAGTRGSRKRGTPGDDVEPGTVTTADKPEKVTPEAAGAGA